jgi:hypothetical protein
VVLRFAGSGDGFPEFEALLHVGSCVVNHLLDRQATSILAERAFYGNFGFKNIIAHCHLFRL